MLVTGIMEMKHADMYIDVTEFTDEEILEHPIFIHNFVMCILSIFVMCLYLIQAWVLFDQWQWVRELKQLFVVKLRKIYFSFKITILSIIYVCFSLYVTFCKNLPRL